MGHPDLNRWRKEHGLETVWHGPKAPRVSQFSTLPHHHMVSIVLPSLADMCQLLLPMLQETVAGLPLLWEPGEKFSYAHDNDLLAFAIEGASGMDFEE